MEERTAQAVAKWSQLNERIYPPPSPNHTTKTNYCGSRGDFPKINPAHSSGEGEVMFNNYK